MGASEVLKVLDKDRELTSTEIAEILDASISSVKRIIGCLLKDITESVEVRELTREEKIARYGYVVPARIRVYKIN